MAARRRARSRPSHRATSRVVHDSPGRDVRRTTPVASIVMTSIAPSASMSATVDADDVAGAGKIGDARECASLAVGVDVQTARGIDEHGVRIRIAIEIRPGERAHVERCRQTVAARCHVPLPLFLQHDGRAFPDANDEIEIAVHLDIGRPDSRAVVGRKRAADRRVTSVNVPSSFCRNREHASGATQRDVGPEVVIPIERRDRCRASASGLSDVRIAAAAASRRPDRRCAGALSASAPTMRRRAVDGQRKRQPRVSAGRSPPATASHRKCQRRVRHGDGVAGGEASTRKRSNGSAISSAGVRTAVRLSENAGTGASTLRRIVVARGASSKLPSAATFCTTANCSLA